MDTYYALLHTTTNIWYDIYGVGRDDWLSLPTLITHTTMYKNIRRWLLLPIHTIVFMGVHAAGLSADHSLWYIHPAATWEEALPLGNGRLGAMVYGHALDEHFQLNEATLWSGVPLGGNNPEARMALPYVRQAWSRGAKKNVAGPQGMQHLKMCSRETRL